MKAIAILWNSMENHFEKAIDEIMIKATISDILTIDFQDKFIDFIKDIYPYKLSEKWKQDYKIAAMNNKYSNNTIAVLFLDIPDCEKIYNARKKREIYRNVEILKEEIREKYKNIVDNYMFDNVFHMTDDETEYEETLLIIKKHFLLNVVKRNSNDLKLEKNIQLEKEYIINNDFLEKKNNFWMLDYMFMFKKEKLNSYQSYSEFFASEIARTLKINVAFYIMASYKNDKGVLTVNFINNEEYFVDGSHLIDFYLTETINEKLENSIQDICSYNNFEYFATIIRNYCEKNDLKYNDDVLLDLKKIFIFDIILLQTDRNPNNWGILINTDNNTIRLAPAYDNANFMGMNCSILENINMSLDDYYNSPTAMLLDSNDNFFDSKEILFQKIDDDEMLNIYNNYFSILSKIDFDTYFCQLEKTYNMSFPDNFKKIIKTVLPLNLNRTSDILNKRNKVKKKIKCG